MDLIRAAWPGAAAVACLAALVGCGGPPQPERFPLHGTVRVDGAIVSQGAISLLPTAGNSGPAASAIIRDGRYIFDDQTGPGDGPHRVIVAVDAFAAANGDDASDSAADAPQDMAAMKRSPARRAGNSQRPGISQQDAAQNRPGQWETTYTVPPDGDFQKHFELTAGQ